MTATRTVIRLARFGPPEVMAWAEGPMPARGDGEVLVAVEAIGLNYGDTMVRRGEYRRDQPLDQIPGFEIAGRIVDGPGAGTRVAGFAEHGGAYADHVVLPADRVFALDDRVSCVSAAAVLVQGITAWYGVHRFGRAGRGDHVLVTGAAGGLGMLCTQLCTELGAGVIAVASTERKRELARANGATAAIGTDPDALAAAVRERTGGHGADVVLDGVGGPLFAPAFRALAMSGRYVVLGSASQQPAMLDTRALLPRGQTIAGVLVARVAETDPAEPARAFAEVQARLLSGVLRPQVTVLGPGDLVEAHRAIEARASTGKLVVALESSTGGSR